jgi:hypothetical protein
MIKMEKEKEHTVKVINLDELKGKMKHPFHTDSVIYPDGRTSDRDEPLNLRREESFQDKN